MPNQLSIPFKLTEEVDIKGALRRYINDSTDAHPDEFKADLARWQTLRKDGVRGVARVERVQAAQSYLAQLAFILTKLPSDIGLSVSYTHAFQPKKAPDTLRSLAFERASAVFNLAALCSQLASSQDRSSEDGIKKAKEHYENAAGTLGYLISDALPPLCSSLGVSNVPPDLSEPTIKSLEWLMLAQAQECAWQLVMSNSHRYKNGVIAKLSAQTAALYQKVLDVIEKAPFSVSQQFTKDWLPHIETKRLHFQAAAQFRKSVDDLDGNRYGEELGRLYVAQKHAKRGHDIGRSGGVASAVVQDIRSLLETVQKNIARAERDNDLIYHEDVPDESNLAQIDLRNSLLCGPKVLPGLANPKQMIGSEGFIMQGLLGWGAREAISIYNHNKDNFINEQIVESASSLDVSLDKCLQELNLPASLDALERPVGLPPSLLHKAEEVRNEDGVDQIETWIESVQTLAKRVASILEEAMDILDNEATEDENARLECDLQRLASHEANQSLISKGARYQAMLEQASTSDASVRSKWEHWEHNITELTADEDALEASIPSSANQRSTTSGAVTHKHARSLRALLETAEELRQTRSQVVERARRLSEADDIGPVISRKAIGFEQFTTVEPSMFDDVSDAALAKYDRFIQEIQVTESSQQDLLEQLRARNVDFLRSRRDDPALKERERALQSLDLAYHKYREIKKNLDEGTKFYNGLAAILTEYKEECESWSRGRKLEIQALVHAMQNAALDTDKQPSAIAEDPTHLPTGNLVHPIEEDPVKSISMAQDEDVEKLVSEVGQEASDSHSTPTPIKPRTLKFDDSDDWEELKLPAAPVKSPERSRDAGRKKIAVPRT